MYQVIKHIKFCYGHRLTKYVGKCQHLHGHDARVEVEISSEVLDECGMVIDFIEIKETIQTWIDKEWDHKMLLYKNDPMVEILRAQGEPVVTLEGNPTAEHLAKCIFDQAKSFGYNVSAVRLWESDSSCAVYKE